MNQSLAPGPAGAAVGTATDTDQDIASGMGLPGAAPSPPEAITAPLLLLGAVTLLPGIGAGIGGMALALLLHLIQHLAYGYSPGAIISDESFLQGVVAASPLRRVAVLLGCGFVAGFGGWAVYRFGRPLVSIKRAIEPGGPPMPILATTGHALLQIVTVALGSPLGREVAPREIGAMLAGWLSVRAGLAAEETRIMVACGAGAGLAAVYNVPLAGVIFVLEVLLRTVRPSAVIPAAATSCIATAVAWIGLGDTAQYHMPDYQISAGLVAWSILAGPIMGFAAYQYTRIAAWARARATRCAPDPVVHRGLHGDRHPGDLVSPASGERQGTDATRPCGKSHGGVGRPAPFPQARRDDGQFAGRCRGRAADTRADDRRSALGRSRRRVEPRGLRRARGGICDCRRYGLPGFVHENARHGDRSDL